MAKLAAPRANHLAAIHIAHKALGLSADDAISLKLAITGRASSKDMTAQQRARYLAHLAGLQGLRPTVPHASAKRSPAARSAVDPADARWLKARALWHALAAAGVVHTNTDAALMQYVKRQTRVEHWRFLNGYQVNAVIEALKAWQARATAPTLPASRGALPPEGANLPRGGPSANCLEQPPHG